MAKEEKVVIPIDRTVRRVRMVIAGVLLLFLILPFHYVIRPFAIFPKSSWGFRHTIITPYDIDKMIKSYNAMSKAERETRIKDPLLQKLIDHRVVYLSNTLSVGE